MLRGGTSKHCFRSQIQDYRLYDPIHIKWQEKAKTGLRGIFQVLELLYITLAFRLCWWLQNPINLLKSSHCILKMGEILVYKLYLNKIIVHFKSEYYDSFLPKRNAVSWIKMSFLIIRKARCILRSCSWQRVDQTRLQRALKPNHSIKAWLWAMGENPWFSGHGGSDQSSGLESFFWA